MTFIRSIRSIRHLSLIRLNKAWFKPSYTQPPLFSNPISFNLDTSHIILGPGKLEFLQVLAGKHLATPANSRLSTDDIVYVDFEESQRDKVYLSARYELYSSQGTLESENVNSVKNYILGTNNYNNNKEVDKNYVDELINLFNLTHLQHKWINSLSNGQLRRARLAKELVGKPSLLIIDDLFLGLDPNSSQLVSECLQKLGITVVLGLRGHDKKPEWIGEVKYVDEAGVRDVGGIAPEATPEEVYKLVRLREITKGEVMVNQLSGEQGDLQKVQGQIQADSPDSAVQNQKSLNQQADSAHSQAGLLVPHLEFVNASIRYSSLAIIANLNWKIPTSTKWRILGDNGTGKTSLLSIITGDHPQSYKGIIKINGKLRKPGDGLTFFQLNNKIGISSPELHSLVPRNKTMLQLILNGLVANVGNSNFLYQYQGEVPQHAKEILSRFPEVFTYGDTPFHQLSMTYQKLALFLRAVIKQPVILILDEAFSSMNDVEVMKRCHELVDQMNMTVLIIGHLEWELPKYDYVIKLMGDEARSYKFYEVEKEKED